MSVKKMRVATNKLSFPSCCSRINSEQRWQSYLMSSCANDCSDHHYMNVSIVEIFADLIMVHWW